jgi:basic membrane protein A
MRKIIAIIICLSLALSCAACGGQKDAIDPDTVANCLIVLITDKNMMGDGGLNDACWEGLQAAADEFEDLSVKYVESKESYSESIEEAVDMDADLIICPNADMAEALRTDAAGYEGKIFVVFDAEVPEAENVTTISFNKEQSAFLAGVVAAMTTEKNVVGFIGAENDANVGKSLYGFTAGVVSTNKKCFISTNYLGKDGSVSQAKQTAVAQFKLGADVIFQLLDAKGAGVMKAADERGFKTISLNPQFAKQHPDSSLCVISPNGRSICYDLAARMMQGTFDGSTITYGLANDAFCVDNMSGFISEEVMSRIETYIAAIKAGGYIVPYDNATYQEFISKNLTPDELITDEGEINMQAISSTAIVSDPAVTGGAVETQVDKNGVPIGQ